MGNFNKYNNNTNSLINIYKYNTIQYNFSNTIQQYNLFFKKYAIHKVSAEAKLRGLTACEINSKHVD